MSTAQEIFLAVVVLGGGYAAYSIVSMVLQVRGARRALPARWNGVWTVEWSGRLDALREQLVEALGAHASAWSFSAARGPAIAIIGTFTRNRDFLNIRLRRVDKKTVSVEARSTHPLQLPPKGAALDGLRVLDEVLAKLLPGQATRGAPRPGAS